MTSTSNSKASFKSRCDFSVNFETGNSSPSQSALDFDAARIGDFFGGCFIIFDLYLDNFFVISHGSFSEPFSLENRTLTK